MTPRTFRLLRARHPAFAFAFAVAMASSFAAGEESTLALTLRSRAVVPGPRVLLSDLVEVARDDDGVARFVMGADLGPSPRVGETVHIDLAQIDGWMRARPRRLPSIRWNGASVVEVERASQSVAGTAVTDVARHALDGWLSTRADSARVTLRPLAGPVVVPPGRVSLAARTLPDAAMPAHRMTVWIDVSVDGRHERAVPVDFEVAAMRRGWVVLAPVERGRDLQATQFEQASVDVTRLGSQPLFTGAIDRLRARRPLGAGQTLTAADVEPRPDVVRGERVLVWTVSGDLSVQIEGEALQDGREGQQVWVHVDRASGPVAARVLRPGLVRVTE